MALQTNFQHSLIMKAFLYLLFPLYAILVFPTKPPPTVISCGPAAYTFQATISSVQSGNWSDPATWGGRVPASGDAPVISAGHLVIADTSVTVAGMQVAGTLTFDSTKSVTITSNKNILVTGLLQMLSPRQAIIHTIRFTGIDEKNFVGGGMDPLDSDIGLWVMGAGQLHLQGADKTSWSNASTSVANGATGMIMNDVTGWQPGDSVLITATATGATNYETRAIVSIATITAPVSGTKTYTIALSKPVTAHPMINNLWTAEVGNLTRNVRIEGTAAGRAHVFIRSTAVQSVKNVSFRYLGPRKDQDGDGIPDLVVGRYGVHFHHCDDGSVGSLVQGCVMRDLGNHAYVPHVSNGITMRDNIAYNCTESPFWWDINDATNALTWVHNLVVQPNYIFHSLGFDTPGAGTLGVNGFVLGVGDDNRCDSNVVAGQQAQATTNAAYDWEEMPIESAWGFKGNMAHNCYIGIRSWQNNGKNHVLDYATVYNSATGILHGAYLNNYDYINCYFYNAVFEDHAASAENGVRIENSILDGGGQIDYPLHMVDGPAAGQRPVFVRNCILMGGKKGAIFDESTNKLKSLDAIQCNIIGAITIAKGANSGETIRVQPSSGQAYKITKSGKTNIAAFAPTIWGEGTGLLGQYFNNTDFTDLAETRIDPVINFPEWQLPLPGALTGVHYKIKDQTYSIRFTGYFQAQFSEAYKFLVATGGGVRLWVDGKLVVDKWADTYTTTYTSPAITLVAGQRYAIELDYMNTDALSSLYLYWQSASQPKQLMPQTQLYPN